MLDISTLITPKSRDMEWLWQSKATAWQLHMVAPGRDRLSFNRRDDDMLSSALRWQCLTGNEERYYGSWGKGLRHIRIDWLSLQDLLVDRLDSL